MMLKTTPIFALLELLTPYENWGGVGEISGSIVEALPTAESPNYI